MSTGADLLADRLERFLGILKFARKSKDKSIGVWPEDVATVEDAVQVLRAASAPAAGEVVAWLELREPRCVPVLKGPFPQREIADTLREFMAARPDAFITVVTVHDGAPSFQDGPECLMMADGRSMSVARRHIKSSTAAFAATVPSASGEALDPTDEMIDAALAVDWENDGDTRAVAVNVWHAMNAAGRKAFASTPPSASGSVREALNEALAGLKYIEPAIPALRTMFMTADLKLGARKAEEMDASNKDVIKKLDGVLAALSALPSQADVGAVSVGEVQEAKRHIDERLDDLLAANAIYGKDTALQDKVARNDREIWWLKDLRSTLTAGIKPGPSDDVQKEAAPSVERYENELFLKRGEVRSILMGQPDEHLEITELVLAEIDELQILTRADIATPPSGTGAEAAALTIDDVPSCGMENDWRRATPPAVESQ